MQEYNKIITDINNKIYKPIYFFSGDEPYYIDRLTQYIEQHVLGEAEKSFNQLVIYGKDTDVFKIIEHARKFPMMSNYQVIIIKEAQDISNIEEMAVYAKNPLKSTILVINYKYKKLDSRKTKTKEFKDAISKNGVSFESNKLKEYQIPGWVEEYIKSKKLKIQQKAILMISEHIGNDLSRIINEIEKLIIAVGPEKSEITCDDVEKNIGISKEYNNFELQNALIKKDILKSNRIIDYYIKNPKTNPPILTITSLFYFFSKLMIYHTSKNRDEKLLISEMKIIPYYLKDYKIAAKNYPMKKNIEIISYLREYNMRNLGVDGSGSNSDDLLKEMIFKILH